MKKEEFSGPFWGIRRAVELKEEETVKTAISDVVLMLLGCDITPEQYWKKIDTIRFSVCPPCLECIGGIGWFVTPIDFVIAGRMDEIEREIVKSAHDLFPDLVAAAATPAFEWVVNGRSRRLFIEAEPFRRAWTSEIAIGELKKYRLV